jgi:hypothetical protein
VPHAGGLVSTQRPMVAVEKQPHYAATLRSFQNMHRLEAWGSVPSASHWAFATHAVGPVAACALPLSSA